ncbi:hypothetical protein RND81_06G153400 [Saponaria officinalis]|uniref:Uncharacterized protein n=1 Tax=Saponaria officinalis TaxID=3572 RepID=A0AAW1KC00_SAPOF
MSTPRQALLDIIRGAVNARELILDRSLVKFSAIGDNPTPTYSNLERLVLGSCFRVTWKYLTAWLANSPQLETVVFKKVRYFPLGIVNSSHASPCAMVLWKWSRNYRCARSCCCCLRLRHTVRSN